LKGGRKEGEKNKMRRFENSSTKTLERKSCKKKKGKNNFRGNGRNHISLNAEKTRRGVKQTREEGGQLRVRRKKAS